MKIGTLTVLASAIAFALLTASAQAQNVGGMGGAGGTGGGFGGRHSKQGKTEKAETQKPKVDENAYNAALNQLPNKKFDAWNGVR
jgi:Spy/CpxP family protein refolding chaperone